MSMSDCEKCWNTPCCCGWEFRNMNKGELEYLIKGIMKHAKLKKLEVIKMIVT